LEPEQELLAQAKLPEHWLSSQQPALDTHLPPQFLKPDRHIDIEQA
jgi:hypothetical protein